MKAFKRVQGHWNKMSNKQKQEAGIVIGSLAVGAAVAIPVGIAAAKAIAAPAAVKFVAGFLVADVTFGVATSACLLGGSEIQKMRLKRRF